MWATAGGAFLQYSTSRRILSPESKDCFKVGAIINNLSFILSLLPLNHIPSFVLHFLLRAEFLEVWVRGIRELR